MPVGASAAGTPSSRAHDHTAIRAAEERSGSWATPGRSAGVGPVQVNMSRSTDTGALTHTVHGRYETKDHLHLGPGHEVTLHETGGNAAALEADMTYGLVYGGGLG